MKAIDTNVVVRLLMRDDPRQTAVADDVVDRGVFVPLTVLLETGRLLESHYRLPRAEVARSLHALLDIPEITVQDAEKAAWAIDRFSKAGDLADLVHLVASTAADAFTTFDKALARQAGPNPPIPIETLKA